MQRQQLIQSWLETLFPDLFPVLSPVSADASFRRYFRVTLANKAHYIAMDAPPQHEDCHSFIHVAELFAAAGVNVPRVIAQNLPLGCLLLTDLGDATYLSQLNSANCHLLYRDAIDALIQIQSASQIGVLPDYDRAVLTRELQLFPDWYVVKHLGVALSAASAEQLQTMFARLLDNNLAQGRVYVHRDYHSRNLMLTTPNPGVLDFQDALFGPISYDLVSLLKDAYIRWDEEQVLDWVIRYWEKARRAKLPVAADFGEFYRDFEWMGLQRHLKVLGIFARLYYRDGKVGYLQDMPVVLEYVRKTAARYAEFKPLLHLLDEWHGAAAVTGFTF